MWTFNLFSDDWIGFVQLLHLNLYTVVSLIRNLYWDFIKIDSPTLFLILFRELRELFRWVAPEPRCALVIKNLLRAATLAGYSNFLHQFVFIFLGLIVQSLVFCRENIHAFVFNMVMVKDEPDMLRREEALARVEKVQEMDLSYQVMSFGGSFFDFSALCSLCKLDLSHNQLYELPEAIGSLLSLTHLFLNDNY